MEQLTRLRGLKGYSQRALAKESGVSPATIYELENGRRRPNPSTLRKLAKALGVEVVDLLGPQYPKVTALPTPAPLLDEDRWAPGFREWLKEHGAQRILMSDEGIIDGFKRLASGSARQDITDRFAQEWGDTYEEETAVVDALGHEYRRNGDLFREVGQGLSGFELAVAVGKEWSRLKRETSRAYGRYYRALESYNKMLYFTGQADDYVIVNKRPQTVEAERAATRALQEEAYENERGA